MKMDEAKVIIDEEISKYELDEYQKEKTDSLKEKSQNTQTKITSNKKEIKEILKTFLKEIDDCKDIYALKALTK
jgi:hypothetical protein